MASGNSIHIGLNSIDPDSYAGWTGLLSAGENDARSMLQIAQSVGYQSSLLLTREATSTNIFKAIGEAADKLTIGDICVITYAGHGGRFEDLSNDEKDKYDETWLLFDREVIDDEIFSALSRFKEGVRVVVISDSCHSGTVIRKRTLLDSIEAKPDFSRLRSRGVPPIIQKKVISTNRDFYQSIRARTPRSSNLVLGGSLILISGCQDDEESFEDEGQGRFTSSLIEAWDNGRYSGNYKDIHNFAVERLKPYQVPNFLTEGTYWPEFLEQVPFTIETPNSRPLEKKIQAEPKNGVDVPSLHKLDYNVCLSFSTSAQNLDSLELQAVLDSFKAFTRRGFGKETISRSDTSREQEKFSDLFPNEYSELIALYRSGLYNFQELSDLFSLDLNMVKQICRNPLSR